uniref:Chromo domain-containing protein n=1 Tax=Tanacetum cinerariifolium TaxID=118510 RepID=A0A6L2JS83_TANCI|nr:hypothetical protein [Tanacetum cinerariifolium]
MRQNSLYAKMSKCNFAAKQVEYLGHIISWEGVSIDPSKIIAMQKWPTPVTLKQLRGFLRLRGYYRRFIKDYASISKPLTSLLKKNSFAWNSSVHASFEALKVAMSQDQVLALPDFNKAFIVETDASRMGIGVVLQQGVHPIAYLIKKLGTVLHWRGMKKLVKKFIVECDVCQRNEPNLSAYPVPLQPLPILTKVWHDISMDFIKLYLLLNVGVLPLYRPDEVLSVEPETIIGKRMGKLNNKAVLYVLVKWVNQTEEEATWELYTDLLQRQAITVVTLDASKLKLDTIENSRKPSLTKKINVLEEKAENGSLDDQHMADRLSHLKNLEDLEHLKNANLKQKAKVKWAIEGDENSKFFNGIINNKFSQSRINGISIHGSWVTDPILKKERLFILKVDFDKAFDSLNWSFLDRGMYQMGFSLKWRTWIHGCLNSAYASVIVNGSPTKEFKIQKRLRQSNPLLPYLFIIAMEAFHVTIQEAKANCKFEGIQVWHNNVDVSHLEFADDTLIIGKWPLENAKKYFSYLEVLSHNSLSCFATKIFMFDG